MRLFRNLFDKKEDTFSTTNWIPLQALAQLDEIVKNSTTKTQAIFKHSTRCGISRVIIKQLENKFDLTEEEIDLYFLDVLKFRDISNAITIKFDVIHQSPQLIIINNKKVTAHDSHHGVLSVKLK